MKKFLTYLFITIAAVEVSLQITSFALQTYTARAQRSENSGKGQYRILCIGESTTAMGGENSYPALLEKKLNSIVGEGTFEVVNAGISGVNTKVIAGKISEWLDLYNPDAAIVMTGINDYWTLPENGVEKWEKNLEWLSHYSRIAKIIHIAHINAKFKDTTFSKSYGTCGVPEPSVFEGYSSFNDFLSQASHVEKTEGTPKAIAFLEKKIALLTAEGFCTDTYPLQEQIVRYQRDNLKDPKLALKTIEDFLRHNIIPRKRLRLVELKDELRFQLRMPPDNHRYATAINYWDNSFYRINIQNILKQLQQQDIPVIVMQYPRLPIEPIKSVIINHIGLTFLENKKVFDDALKEKKFDDLFEDEFGKVFGHTTPLGASILANNVAEKILEVIPVQKKK